MSLSLALGILVGDVGGLKLLTSAHAQDCGGSNGDTTLISKSVNIKDGFILNGITVRGVNVNGTHVEQAVIAGLVQIVDATVEGSPSLIQVNGVIVGSGSPCTNGVIVGSGGATTNGVIVGSGDATPSLYGVNGDASGTAAGGTLTGDDIVITNGYITGQNLLLSGATFNNGSISGTIASVTLTPAN